MGIIYIIQIFLKNKRNSTLKNPVLQTLNVRIKNVLREKGLLEMGKTSKYYDPASINKNKVKYKYKILVFLFCIQID